MNSSRPLRIAWFSPLATAAHDAAASLSVYFSAQIVPRLAAHFTVDLYHDRFEPVPGSAAYHYLSAAERHERQPYDIFFYQIEDRAESDFVRGVCNVIPGVTLFHDLYLTRDRPAPMANSAWTAIRGKFHDRNLPWPARDAKFDVGGPLAEREATMALAMIATSVRNVGEYRRQITDPLVSAARPHESADQRSFFLPLPIPVRAPRVLAGPQAAPKSGPGPETAATIGFAGTPRIEHRAHKLFQALRDSARPWKLVWLIEDHERDAAQALLDEFGIDFATLVGGRSPQRWQALIDEIDIALHPMFSMYGDISVYLGASMMAGLPCVVTRFVQTDHIPEGLVFKIDPGFDEALQIREILRTLHDRTMNWDPQPVHDFAHELHDPAAVADQLGAIFRALAPGSRDFLAGWQGFQADARRSLLQELADIMPLEGAAERRDVFDRLLRPVYDELGWSR